MKTARFNRAVRVGVPALLAGLFGALLPPDAVAQQADAQGATGLERVMQAIEHLSPELQDEVVDAYQHAARHAFHSIFQSPACMALEYLEWRRNHPDHSASRARETFFLSESERRRVDEACADRETIVEYQTARADRLLASDRGLTEDQRTKIAACVGDTVADRYLEQPELYLNLRRVFRLFTAVLSECRGQPSR